jgi:hypothetical protein
MLIDFYIVVHNINLINFFEDTEKYKDLVNYKYLLVGKHETDYSNNKIIQCDKLPDNIEDKNYYLAYTGWYALANNLTETNTQYICFLEYDTDVMPEFNLSKLEDTVRQKDLDCCGLTYMPLHDGIFVNTQFTHKTLSYLKDQNIREIKPNNHNWMTTNNMFFKKDFLKKYFSDTFTKNFLIFLDNDPMSGHFLERFLSIYCFINNIQFDIIEQSGLVHRGLDSHRTQNIFNTNRGYEQFKAINKISD